MDTKSLAKSKRAHSLHKKKNHHHNPNPTSTKPPSSVPKPLPSNSDRYSDSVQVTSQPSDLVLPKTKGADYGYLISEAQSQSRFSSHAFPFHDFTQDFGPLLAEKGQSILSWIADDNFGFDEDKASTNVEAPFLSLNLNALAEQLSKAKLSQRLFIESDLLPPELLDDELQAYGENKNETQTCTSAVEMGSGASFVNNNNQASSKNVQQYRKPISSAQGLEPIEQIKDEIILQSKQTNRTSASNLTSAEAELDMLLNSFTDTKLVESSTIEIQSISDDIDISFEETSDPAKMDGRGLSHGSFNVANDAGSSTVHLNPKSKLLDDFDSWLDTI